MRIHPHHSGLQQKGNRKASQNMSWQKGAGLQASNIGLPIRSHAISQLHFACCFLSFVAAHVFIMRCLCF